MSKSPQDDWSLEEGVMIRERAARADLDWFDAFMARDGGAAPEGDDRP